MKNKKKFKRACPQCGKEMRYLLLVTMNRAIEKNSLCYSCGHLKNTKYGPHRSVYIRKCPACGQDIIYKKRSGYLSAIKQNKDCLSCSRTTYFIKAPYVRECRNCKLQITYKNKYDFIVASRRNSLCHKCTLKSNEFRTKLSLTISGNKNPMFGRSVYSVWIEKYGKAEADRRKKAAAVKKSAAASGKKNPMYGRVTKGSGGGCGWSGWYKDWYFRSIGELAYAVMLDKANIPWDSAESEEYLIEYILDGKERTYRADFIVDKKTIIEVKPIQLQDTKIMLEKKKAAQDFCLSRNLEFKIESPPTMTIETFTSMYNSGIIRLTKKWDDKFKSGKLNLRPRDKNAICV